MESFILDDFIWSFSRLEKFFMCPKAFQLQYLKEIKGAEGVFGQFGDLIHNCLEKYIKGEIAEYDLAYEYTRLFDTYVTGQFPPSRVDLRESYFQQGLEYFNSFTGFGDKKILGVENFYNFKVDKYDFSGKIDVETSNEIIDHKTKKRQHLIRLTKKHNKDEYITMVDGRYIHYINFIQLYIYCIPYFDKHKHYPQYLSLNMARIKDWYTVEFDEKFFEISKQWLIDQIHLIYQTTKFNKGDGVDSFWCDNSCAHRFDCPHSDKYFQS